VIVSHDLIQGSALGGIGQNSLHRGKVMLDFVEVRGVRGQKQHPMSRCGGDGLDGLRSEGSGFWNGVDRS
jgi:hypothetical protein